MTAKKTPSSIFIDYYRWAYIFEKPLFNRVLVFTTFLFIFVIFFWKNSISLDPDLGWHLKEGEYILTQGIPKKDPFSYTMPSFPVIDHSWVSNVLLTLTYPTLGSSGLALIYALFATSAIFIVTPIKSFKWYYTAILLLVSSIVVAYLAIRPLVISWVFLAILVKICFEQSLWQKYKFLIPLLFVIWVNFHGGFPIGLVFLLLFLILRVWEKKLSRVDLLVGFLSILTTAINPYGPRIWQEVWLTLTDTGMKWYINEWKPLYYQISFINRVGTFFFIILTTIILTLGVKINKDLVLGRFVIFLLFLLAAISTRRNIPLYLIVSLPLVFTTLDHFYQRIDKSKAYFRICNILTTLILITIPIFIFQAYTNFKSAYNFMESFHYPKNALDFIKRNNFEGQIFSSYGWGGYLIRDYPQKKVFVDGRMPSWRWDPPNDIESAWAFKEYAAIAEGQVDFKPIFEKYDIKVVLWPVKIKDTEDVDEPFKKSLKIGANIKPDGFLERLEQAGWKIVYYDLISAVYIKP